MTQPGSFGGIEPHQHHQYEIALPCPPEEFRNFISGLLGKPQTAEQSFYGAYEVDLSTLTNLHHLVDQRVHQQNDASLVQFIAKIYYDDNSSVQINSFEDLSRYQEVHPKVSVAVSLTWIYLITFQRKTVPEKQQIEVVFGRGRSDFIAVRSPPEIKVSVAYTERTWGMDLQSLLGGHIRGLIQRPTHFRQLLSRRSEIIGVVAGIMCFLLSVLGVIYASSRLIEVQMEAARRMATASLVSMQQLAERIDFLISIIGQGVWPRFSFAAVGLLLVALVLAIVVGAIVSALLEKTDRAYVLLTDASRRNKERITQQDRSSMSRRVASLLISIAVGIASNILYTKYFSAL